MSYGYRVDTGDGAALVSYGTNTRSSGVYLGEFSVAYNASASMSFPNFQGTEIYVQFYPIEDLRIPIPTISINQATKTVSASIPAQASTGYQTGCVVAVFGK